VVVPLLETCRQVGVGRLARHTNSKGTAVKKSSQNQPVDATVPVIPERISVAMAEIAESTREGLLALAVGAGLQVMQSLMEADVTLLAGRRANTTRHVSRCVTAVSTAR
jgi:putative transposase